jgi:hypothetical protein
MIMERLGTIVIEDIGSYAKSEGRLPTVDELMAQYQELPHFEVILSTIEISMEQLEKFIGALLKEDEIEDFGVAELKAQ